MKPRDFGHDYEFGMEEEEGSFVYEYYAKKRSRVKRRSGSKAKPEVVLKKKKVTRQYVPNESGQQKSPIAASGQSDTKSSKTEEKHQPLFIVSGGGKVITKRSMDDTDLLVNLYNTIVETKFDTNSLHTKKLLRKYRCSIQM